MRLGIIDLGTNSVRFDVHDLKQSGKIRCFHREKLMVRLGQEVFVTGKLSGAAVRRTEVAFRSFKATADSLKVEKILAFGTATLRELEDASPFIERIKTETGIEIQVITGPDEASLIAKGILRYEKKARGNFALMDVGGGSTEITICKNAKPVIGNSFKLGTARIQQVFLRSSPPAKATAKAPQLGIAAARGLIRRKLRDRMAQEGWPKVPTIIGSSGTVQALCRLIHQGDRSETEFDRRGLKILIKKMEILSSSGLLALPGMEAKRVDMILAGAVLVDEVMDAVGAKKMIRTEYSLRDGILASQLEIVELHETSEVALHLDELADKAIALGAHKDHLGQVVQTSLTLFQKLKRLHKLGDEWQVYLHAAALLHDVGEIINTSDHAEHSYYIVKNMDFPTHEAWEVDFIAGLCRFHNDKKYNPAKTFPFPGQKKKEEAFTKILAILQIADALDRGHKQHLEIGRIQKSGKGLIIHLKSKTSCDLEILRLEQKKTLFEKIFSVTLKAVEDA